VYDGVLAAFDRLQGRDDLPVRVALETRDTERDVDKATEEARNLVKDQSVIGILGPMFSNTTTAAARVAGANRVPLVTPTANQNGIAALGATVFQANPDYEQRGRAMARYAVKKLGAKVLGVLAPSDSYAKFLADAFIKEARSLGAIIACTEWYQKGDPNLRKQFMSFRLASRRYGSEPVLTFGGKMNQKDIMKLLRVGASPSTVDSCMLKGLTVPVKRLLGPRGVYLLDSIGVAATFDNTGVDSLAHPEAGINALYCPISGPEEIGIISSQIVYHGLVTQILGSGEWNSPADLEANRRYAAGVQFESDSYVDTASARYKDFLRVFQSRFKRLPSKNSMYGYDTASMMLDCIIDGATTRDKLTAALSNIRNYRGVKGAISFTEGRVNGALHVLQFGQRGVSRITELSTTE
jgi:ABC-type branched-subunit amino acid transport system substrate-binding protein